MNMLFHSKLGTNRPTLEHARGSGPLLSWRVNIAETRVTSGLNRVSAADLGGCGRLARGLSSQVIPAMAIQQSTETGWIP